MHTATMRIRSIVAPLAALSLLLTGVAAANPAQAAGTSTVTLTAQQMVAQLPVVPPLYAGYRGVEQFIPKAIANKKDARGCNLRQRMIIGLATVKPKIGKRCSMKGGTWIVGSSRETVTNPKTLILYPTTSYKTAWGQGAYAWTPQQRLAWATNTSSMPSRSRAKGVTTQQATQQLMSTAEFQKASQGIKDSVHDSQEFYRFFQSCIDGGSATFGCLAGVYAIWVMRRVVQGDDAPIPLPDACDALRTKAANITAWGLSVSPDDQAALSAAMSVCPAGEPLNLILEWPKHGIDPAQQPSVVSNNLVLPGESLLVSFDGYGTPDTPAVTPALFGIAAPVDWGAPGVPAGYLRLWDSSVSWRDIETAPGKYDWSKMDQTIAMARTTGAAVMYVLGNTPAWANGGKGGNVPPTNVDDAANFIGALCDKYKGSISSYEVWNEGNLPTFWTGGQYQLAQLTAKIKSTIDNCNPAAIVIASSTGTRATNAFATSYGQYLDELRLLGWPVEGFAVHSYPAANGTPQDRVNELAQFKTMLAVKGAPALPIFDTELNYGLAGLGQEHVVLDPLTSAGYLSQSFIQSVQYGVDSLFWFLWTRDDEPKLGIQLHPGTTQTIQAWQTTYNWLVGSRMQRCMDSGNLQACQLTAADGKNFTLLWTKTGTVDVNTKALGSQICELAGRCYETSITEHITVDIAPIRIN